MRSRGRDMVIVDSSVWLQAFNVQGSPERREVDELLERREAAMVGAVLAEVLQGARRLQEFERLRADLSAVPYVAETQDTWIRVGTLSYELRRQGLTVPLMDLLIATLALEHGHELYTGDEHFRRVPGLTFYRPSPSGKRR